MALAAAADGHVAVETALSAATLQSSSSVWLAQFPSEVSWPWSPAQTAVSALRCLTSPAYTFCSPPT
jgi:hypothetical protein